MALPEIDWMQAKKKSRPYFVHCSSFMGNRGDLLSVIPKIDGRERRHKFVPDVHLIRKIFRSSGWNDRQT
jgi:hypothetical protein